MMQLEVKMDFDKLINFEDTIDIKQTTGLSDEYYQMTLSQFVNTISKSVDASMTQSIHLPANCIRYVHIGLSLKLYCVVPKKQWIINYLGNYYKVGFPKLILEYLIVEKANAGSKSYEIKLKRIVAVKDNGPIKKDTKVFHFPYSHVDNYGSVCMGSTQIRDMSCLSELEAAHSYFFDSPFSSDYGEKILSKEPLHVLFAETFFEKDFNDELLVPHNKTFDAFFDLTK
ncbi:hypothetical protein D5E69_23205 (plasmid) [Rossellomorea marisflavi]|uniref:hypothetical protein n=1 Tax=Rossellomorea marisflavi TaxID=189381 RepID=UPI00131970D0|nr:hypothetical protein [Rossellomorea marisflavi]QHA38742.1 hypothetical protein D5E69_23205 [Rossellomorea marisflavi]